MDFINWTTLHTLVMIPYVSRITGTSKSIPILICRAFRYTWVKVMTPYIITLTIDGQTIIIDLTESTLALAFSIYVMLILSTMRDTSVIHINHIAKWTYTFPSIPLLSLRAINLTFQSIWVIFLVCFTPRKTMMSSLIVILVGKTNSHTFICF